MTLRLVLASGSPRRRELLALLGRPFDVIVSDVDESVVEGELAVDYVARVAQEKALAVAVEPDTLVIAADTTVALDGKILGKPADAADGRAMLTSLAGRRHETHTCVCLRLGEAMAREVVTTMVEFAAMSAAEIDWYVATGEPLDKAGAYGLQGVGGCFVRRVEGDVQNVIGLPMGTVLRLASALGVNLLV